MPPPPLPPVAVSTTGRWKPSLRALIKVQARFGNAKAPGGAKSTRLAIFLQQIDLAGTNGDPPAEIDARSDHGDFWRYSPLFMARRIIETERVAGRRRIPVACVGRMNHDRLPYAADRVRAGESPRMIAMTSEAKGGTLRVAEARQTIVNQVRPVTGIGRGSGPRRLGSCVAQDVVAPFDVPAHDNSAMDGYCLRAADLSPTGETRLTVVGTALAGAGYSGLVDAGQAVRIMTGAPIPAGGDTVVIQEDAGREGDAVIVPPGVRAGQNLRRAAGEDLAAGKPALRTGKRVGPADLGLIASLGFAEVSIAGPESPSSRPETNSPPSAGRWPPGEVLRRRPATPCSAC